MLSTRNRTWLDDLISQSRRAWRPNVGRMVAREPRNRSVVLPSLDPSRRGAVQLGRFMNDATGMSASFHYEFGDTRQVRTRALQMRSQYSYNQAPSGVDISAVWNQCISHLRSTVQPRANAQSVTLLPTSLEVSICCQAGPGLSKLSSAHLQLLPSCVERILPIKTC